MSLLDEHLDKEQAWLGSEKRQQRQMRKLAQKTDRSKYKKTDQDAKEKLESLEAEENSLSLKAIGRVVEIRAGDIFAICEKCQEPSYIGQKHLLHVKGAFKSNRSRSKNLVAVGDLVAYEPYMATSTVSSSQILRVLPRQSVLSRADNLNHQKEQILATNVDYLVIVFSLIQPILSLHLIDRFLIAAAKGSLSPILVITKIDLLDNQSVNIQLQREEKAKLDYCLKTYPQLGIPTFCYREDRIDSAKALEELLSGKTAVFSGPSGVGKSTLLSLFTGHPLRVQSVSGKTGRGSHTTCHAQLISMRKGGYCVDTPGIRSLALWNLEKESVQTYFSEIAKEARLCQFRDCSHRSEPGCAVTAGVDSDKILKKRYESYLSLMQELSEHHLRR